MTNNSANQAAQMAPSPAAELLGYPDHSSIDSLIDPEAVTASQITNIARMVMEENSTVIKESGVEWKVSLGQEHFAEANGLVDLIAGDMPNFSGFRLWQRVNKRNQLYEPIYLVANADIKTPVVTLQPTTQSIMKSQLDNLSITDAKELVSVAKIVVPIAAASYQRAEEIQESHESDSKQRHHRVKKWIAGLVVAASLSGGAARFAPEATSWFHNYRETVGREHREDQAREALESQKAAEVARQARLEREAKVRAFDQKYDLEDSIAITEAGEVGSAQSTDMFTDVKVPKYNAEDIAGGIAHDLSSPRAVEIETYDTEENSKGETVIKMNIKEGQQFKVAHNGSPTDSISVYADAEKNTLTIIDNGSIADTETNATQVFIQRVAQ